MSQRFKAKVSFWWHLLLLIKEPLSRSQRSAKNTPVVRTCSYGPRYVQNTDIYGVRRPFKSFFLWLIHLANPPWPLSSWSNPDFLLYFGEVSRWSVRMLSGRPVLTQWYLTQTHTHTHAHTTSNNSVVNLTLMRGQDLGFVTTTLRFNSFNSLIYMILFRRRKRNKRYFI